MRAASEETAKLLQDNWQRVVLEVSDACRAAGRRAEEVQVVGVSKYVGPELAWQLVQAGCPILAENRPQLLWEKYDYFSERNSPNADQQSPQWHLIGHLQRNKLRRTLPMIALLHSLDSLRLAEAISLEGVEQQTRHRVLCEVNVSRDTNKTGLMVDDLRELLQRAVGLSGIEICGLMAMSSLNASEDVAQREFEQVRELRDQLQSDYAGQFAFNELSMGMSGDFRAAIAAGATLVRIGSHIWQGIL